MTNEEKILARLDELTAEIREAKQAIRPYVETQAGYRTTFKRDGDQRHRQTQRPGS